MSPSLQVLTVILAALIAMMHGLGLYRLSRIEGKQDEMIASQLDDKLRIRALEEWRIAVERRLGEGDEVHKALWTGVDQARKVRQTE